MDFSDISHIVQEQGLKLLAGIFVLVMGLSLAHWVMKFLGKNDRFNRFDPTLRGFLHNFLKIIVYIVIVLTAANIMGVPMTSFVTLLASASVAITLAMQGALSNFVGGISVMLLKLFRKGDYVKIGENEGTVQNIGIFYTELVTPDNRHISLPNSSLSNTAVINYTREGTRRLDVNFSVSYTADINAVREVLLSAAERTEKILQKPEPIAKLVECGDSSLVFMVRIWCNASDYWMVNWSLLENGKRALDNAGIEIPYPQVDIHMK